MPAFGEPCHIVAPNIDSEGMTHRVEPPDGSSHELTWFAIRTVVYSSIDGERGDIRDCLLDPAKSRYHRGPLD
ncbi:MAG: hypothetical protein RLZZ01_249, partial [Actinomycetota bacterium]